MEAILFNHPFGFYYGSSKEEALFPLLQRGKLMHSKYFTEIGLYVAGIVLGIEL